MTSPDEPFIITITPDRRHIHLTGRGADAIVSVGDRDADVAAELGAETLRGLGRTVEIVRA